MADEVVINGVASDEQTGESFSDLDQRGDNDARVADLSRKIESLEHEKLRLVHENAETKERIKRLTAEIEELRYEEASTKEKLGEMEKEIERSEDARKALEATAARAAELETEVSTLQHYLISTLSDSDEANRELFGLKRVLKEKGVRVENLERMVESLEREKVEGEKRVRDLEREKVEGEKRVRDLERKVGVLEMKEIEEKSMKVRIEEEMRDRIGEKEREIDGFRKKAEDLESAIAKNGVELEKWMREKPGLEALVKESEEQANLMELKVIGLQKEVSRLQHDLLSKMSDGHEAKKELIGSKRVLEEKGVRVENLERMVESLEREKVEGEKRVRDLERKIGVLEMKKIEEKSKKVRIEEEMRDRIGEKEREIDGFRKKAEDLGSAIAKNGVELEKWMREKPGLEALVKESEEKAKSMRLKVIGLQKEVSRLQHDLLSTMRDGHEAKKELIGSKRVLEEKGVRVENLERMVESLEREKVEGEKRVRDLERKVGVLEMKEIEEKSKKVRIEEEMRDRIGEKEREINGFRKKAEDLESAVAKNGVELEKWMREKLGLEALVKAKSMELKVFRLQKEVEEAEKVIHGLKEKAAEAINGSVNELMVTAGAAEKGLKLDWPVVAAGSTGAIALAAAVAYMIDVKLR